ncbi:hypothetical protein LTR62_003416 [Meristemomyces frigidus]|uniref:MPN domain-containing protein n=1 Tax=Meristemomyces frigidus TaxID=1508187 RepID=A0AAN7TGA8_9PEZI|nr:hypothetical protein LTR62_003416 [Meristemomyces frigidus]
MPPSRQHGSPTEPVSVAELVVQAQTFDFTPSVALQRWLRAAKLLLTEATICERNGNLQSAYLYLYRHAQLVLDRLPQHPDYKDPTLKHEIADAKKAVMRNLPMLEAWKPQITQQYERYRAAVERRDAEGQNIQQEGYRFEPAGDHEYLDHGTDEVGVHGNSAREGDLAHLEIRRRDESRRSTRRAGVSPDTVANRRRGIVAAEPDHGMTSSTSGDRVAVDAGIREVGQLVRVQQRSRESGPSQSRRTPSSNTYQYPSVPEQEDLIDWRASTKQQAFHNTADNLPPPPRPAKTSLDSSPSNEPTAPLPPPKPHMTTIKSPTAYTESGAPLRTLLLPPALRPTFLNLAHPNTVQNLETCGILAGTVTNHALVITHLIIPDQAATSDTCDTTDSGDNALFDYCDSLDLLVCGWIHTHPTQTCFLSSRDLHTSSGYQIMLPEAIAIVCAPRQNPDWGCFRLTAPPGLGAVLECRRQGLFHPHEERSLYTDAMGTGTGTGHVVEGEGMAVEVVDLRQG